jgi:hypothetical protein
MTFYFAQVPAGAPVPERSRRQPKPPYNSLSLMKFLSLTLFGFLLFLHCNSQALRIDSITSKGMRYEYRGKTMSQNHLMAMLKKKDLPPPLMQEIQLTHHLRKMQTCFEILGALMVVEGGSSVAEYEVSQYIPTNKYFKSESVIYLQLGIGVLAGGIISGLVAIPVRTARMKHARKVIELYNQMPLN